MPKVSAKRQITLPVAGCIELDICAGDEVEILRYRNQFNIIKKEAGIAAGSLKGARVNNDASERESLMGNFE